MRTRAQHLRFTFAGFLALALGFAWTSPVHAEVTYTGRAFGAFVNVPTLSVDRHISDTGELPPDGTPQSASLTNVTVPGILSVEVLAAETSGANGEAQSSATLLNVSVLPPDHPARVTASFIRAESNATCNGVSGATLAGIVTFGSQTITVDPFAANQKFGPIAVDGLTTATLIINEQIKNSGQGFREITVNAVHLTLEGAVQAEVILSSARSDIHGCPGCPPAPACHDFVTGGGWIGVGNSRANFGFNAGFKGGSMDVHFNYIDHNTGMHMKATSITEYVATGPTSRRLKGNAEIDGKSGHTYTIEVADNGEPGRNADRISISLSNKYSAGGTLAGGNIQLHDPCP
ncbi:MAG: choice-of-anchor P family protein [bacterium]